MAGHRTRRGSGVFVGLFGPAPVPLRWGMQCLFTGILLTFLQLNQPVNGGTLEDLVTLDRLLKDKYDRRATPTNHLTGSNATATRVFCELFVRSFGSPSPSTMDYKVDLYLRQSWTDERLKHKDIKRAMDLNDPNLVKNIWKPEVYFPNAKEADFQFVTVPNVLVRIHPDGKILYMLRLKVTFSCMMDLSKFPLDRQTCTMEVASFSKTVEELVLEWKEENPITTGSLQMTQFAMVNIVAAKCRNESFQIGNYSCLVAEFHLARLLGFHLVQSYLPTILMVVISWVSFWMDVNSVPGRVTLGITTLLTVSSKATNIQENIESSYVKAIDVWMGACTAFVFLALMEFTIVNYLWRREYYHQSSRGSTPSSSRNVVMAQSMNVCGSDCLPEEQEGGEPSGSKRDPNSEQSPNENAGNSWEARFVGNPTNHQFHTKRMKGENKASDFHHNFSDHQKAAAAAVDGFRNRRNYQDLAKKIDESCRFLFPLAFTIFVISYWILYLFL